jgi:hypothetical protein
MRRFLASAVAGVATAHQRWAGDDRRTRPLRAAVQATTRRSVLAVAVGAWLGVALAAASPAMAIDEGVPDGDGHPNVGALVYDADGAGPGGFSYLCTGSVVSDRVFLTAAHCITAFPESDWGVMLQAGSPRNPVYQPGVFPDEFPFPALAPVTPAAEVAVHPRFDPEGRKHDVAVLLFPEGTFAEVTPVQLPGARLLDRRARRGGLRGQRFRLVSYGGDPEWGDTGPPRFILEGYRQKATAPFRALRRGQLLLHNGSASNRQGGLCYGDSGSPQFLGDTNLAVALFSEHDEDCRQDIFAQRLDTRSERNFLARYLP